MHVSRFLLAITITSAIISTATSPLGASDGITPDSAVTGDRVEECENNEASSTDCDCEPCDCVTEGSNEDGKCPKGERSNGHSLINNLRRAHHHEAIDYHAGGAGASGCVPCGAQGVPNTLRNLTIKRCHRYRDLHYSGSFGPGVFCNYDVFILLYRDRNDGLGGNMRIYDPADNCERQGVDRDDDGDYADESHKTYADITLYDINGEVTANQSLAATAILRRHDGHTYHFEIINPSGDPASSQRRGRLTRLLDRNGQGITIAYKQPPNGIPSQLLQIATITDAYNRTATVTYAPQTVGGQYVIASITVCVGEDAAGDPAHGSLIYHYDLNGLGIPEVGAWDIVGLSAVDQLDGSRTTITVTHDPVAQHQIVHYDDPAAGTTHRRKSVGMTLEVWRGTDGTEYPQGGRMVRIVRDGTGEITYMNWGMRMSHGQAICVWERGSVFRYRSIAGYPLGHDVATDVDWNLDPSAWTWKTLESYSHNFNRRITSATDAYGNKTGYGLKSESGAVTSRKNRDNTNESYERNAFQQVTRYVDRDGTVISNAYDAAGNLISRTVAAGTDDEATYRWDYDARGLTTAAYDPLYDPVFPDMHVTEYTYDTAGYLIRGTGPASVSGSDRPVTTFSYDAAGRLATVTDPTGRITTFGYDARGRRTQITYHDASSEHFAYAVTGIDAGLMTQQVDRLGHRTVFRYDGHGRPLSREVRDAATDALVDETAWSYVTGTDAIKTQTMNGAAKTMHYDERMRLTAINSQVSATAQLTHRTVYDDLSRVRYHEDAHGRRLYPVYDEMDRMVRQVRDVIPGGVVTALGPDPDAVALMGLVRDTDVNPAYVIIDKAYTTDGNTESRTGIDGLTTAYGYDARGRRTATRRAVDTALETLASVEYGAAGHIVSAAEPFVLGSAETPATMTTTVDGRNLVSSHTEAAGTQVERTRSFTYTIDGRPRTRVDARGHTWLTVDRTCCPLVVAQLEPQLPDGSYQGTVTLQDDNNRETYRARVGGITDTNGDGEITAADAPWRNFPDADTVSETTTRYDAGGRAIAQTDWLTPLGQINENAAPIAGGLLPGDPPADSGLTTTWTHDDDLGDGLGLDAEYDLSALDLGSAGSAVMVTDPVGSTSLMVLDGLGRTAQTIDADGVVTRMTYGQLDADGLVKTTTIVDPDGLALTTSRHSDGLGRARKSVDANGQPTLITYELDPVDDRFTQTVTDPNNNTATTVADVLGRAIEATDAAGTTTRTEYDGLSNLSAAIDGRGKRMEHSHDALHRRIATRDRLHGNSGLPSETIFAYDAEDNQTAVTDAEGGTTFYFHDSAGRLFAETFPGHLEGSEPGDPGYDGKAYAYDAAGRVIAREDQAGDLTTYLYDMPGRLLVRSYPDGLDDSFEYDAAGRPTVAASSRYGNAVARAYTPAGRLEVELLLIGGHEYTTSNRYDTVGRNVAVAYPSGRVCGKTYTARSQIASVTLDGTPVAGFVYDPAGRETSRTLGNGLVETRTWWEDNLAKTISAPGVADFDYTYDANKRKTSETDGILSDYSQTVGYDDEDRLTSWLREGTDADAPRSQYWDLSRVGDMDTVTTDGANEARDHNAVHEITAVDSVAVEHDAKGNLTHNPKRGQTYTWDYENRLLLASNHEAQDIGAVATAGALTLDQKRFVVSASGYGIRGLRDEFHFVHWPLAGDGTIVARVDNLVKTHNLAKAGVMIRDTLDNNSRHAFMCVTAGRGLFFQRRRNTGGFSAQTRTSGTAPKWVKLERNGNLFTGSYSDDGATWTQLGSITITMANDIHIGLAVTAHLDGQINTATFSNVEIAAPATDNTLLAYYGYDALGRRVRKRANAVPTTFVVNHGWQVLEEYAGPSLLKSFAYGNYVDEPLQVSDATGTGLWYHRNHLYSVSAMSDASGNVQERYSYGAYGEMYVWDASGTPKSGPAIQPYGFTGRRFDDESRLWYFRARYYDDQLGRFLGRDALEYVDGFSMYAGYFVPHALDPTGFGVICQSAETGELDYFDDGCPPGWNKRYDCPSRKTFEHWEAWANANKEYLAFMLAHRAQTLRTKGGDQVAVTIRRPWSTKNDWREERYLEAFDQVDGGLRGWRVMEAMAKHDNWTEALVAEMLSNCAAPWVGGAQTRALTAVAGGSAGVDRALDTADKVMEAVGEARSRLEDLERDNSGLPPGVPAGEGGPGTQRRQQETPAPRRRDADGMDLDVREALRGDARVTPEQKAKNSDDAYEEAVKRFGREIANQRFGRTGK